jgi:nicotinamidase-related amidase
VDTVVVVGCSTSGCVRGTVVDAFSFNFKVAVPHECVFDRSVTTHKVNLFDLAQKYADVSSTADLMTRLREIPAHA